jgi:soluble lytic murein transglycosylase-like protein
MWSMTLQAAIRNRPRVCRRRHAIATLAVLAAGFAWSNRVVAETPPAVSGEVAVREEALRYEHGEGVAKDMERAISLYCDAARHGDATAQFNLGWIYAYGRGVPRDDALAAFFFSAAARQGFEQARRMLQLVGAPTTGVPDCMKEPVVAAAQAPAAAAPPQPAAPPPFQIQTTAPRALVDLVKKLAPQYQVEPQLVLAIMEAESNFDSAAVSPRNAKGLMQLIPETAARFDVKNVHDARQNIRGGLAYLRWLLAYFEGDVTLVAAAYNAGERTVERYGGVPPYGETQRYVGRIVQAVGSLLHPFDASVANPSPRLPFIRESKRAKGAVALNR